MSQPQLVRLIASLNINRHMQLLHVKQQDLYNTVKIIIITTTTLTTSSSAIAERPHCRVC